MHRTGLQGWSIPRSFFALLVVIPFAYPLLFLIATAIRKADAYNRSPLGLSGLATTSHIRYAWYAGDLGTGAINSLIAVPIGVVCCCFASSMAAYWFYRHRGPVAKFLLAGILVGWIIPFAVYLVPFYVQLINRGLTDNLIVLGVSYGAIYTPFGTYFMLVYMRQALQSEVLEAAEVDGASLLRTFWRIVLPLSRPAIGTLAALAFVWMWGEIIVAVVEVGADPTHFTIVLSANALIDQTIGAGGSANTTQSVAAATLISLLPMLSAIYVAQRAIVRGFGAGGVKG